MTYFGKHEKILAIVCLNRNPRTMSTVKEQKITIPGAIGNLQAVISIVEGASTIAICCHPHPLHGGAMTNKVIHTVDKTLNQLGITTIRFNFRGVGASEGEFAEGIGEQDDVLAVVDWVKQEYPNAKIGLAGFSFGSYVTAMMQSKVNPEFLISIAPPVARFDFSNFVAPKCPWIIVMGDADEVVDPQAVFDWVDTFENPAPLLVKMENAGHFFHSRLIDLRERLGNAMRYTLNIMERFKMEHR